jgi:hypothetical protein
VSAIKEDFFDPTDEDSAVGLLPIDEQGSLALLVAADGGKLMRMPASGPEANAIDRSVEASIGSK